MLKRLFSSSAQTIHTSVCTGYYTYLKHPENLWRKIVCNIFEIKYEKKKKTPDGYDKDAGNIKPWIKLRRNFSREHIFKINT